MLNLAIYLGGYGVSFESVLCGQPRSAQTIDEHEHFAS
jgi:hypothetical protein